MYIEVGAAATLGVSPADIKTISAPPTMAIHCCAWHDDPRLPTSEWKTPRLRHLESGTPTSHV